MDGRDGAVRNVLRVEHLRAGHGREAVDGRVGLARHRIARVDDGHPVDDEDVAVRARGQRSERAFPHALSVLRQLRQRHATPADARDVAGTAELHLLRIGREHTKRDAPIRLHFG